MRLLELEPTNVFEVIKNVTNRIEPFHSEFLATCLSVDKTFREDFLHAFLPETLSKQLIESSEESALDIRSEYRLGSDQFIDVVIFDDTHKQIIGIEVKTTDTSVTFGQLLAYNNALKEDEERPNYSVYMIYLTPYNEKSIPDNILGDERKLMASEKEFKEFNDKSKDAIHINWKEVVDLYPTQGSNAALYQQHKAYVNAVISNDAKLMVKLKAMTRNRELAKFIGGDTVTDLETLMGEVNFSELESKYTFSLVADKHNNYRNLKDLVDILCASEKLNQSPRNAKANEVDAALMANYAQSEHKIFFEYLFEKVNKAPYLWLEGKGNLGLRAVHSDYPSSGVSLLTISPDAIEIVRKR